MHRRLGLRRIREDMTKRVSRFQSVEIEAMAVCRLPSATVLTVVATTRRERKRREEMRAFRVGCARRK
ncbi:unnamed protein product [Camellia sinensis]